MGESVYLHNIYISSTDDSPSHHSHSHINHTCSYEELLKVIESYHSQPRTTAQIASNQSLLSRQVPGYDTSSIVAGIEQPLNIRLERGLEALRHTMYMKSSNFHKLFQTLQNGTNKQIRK